jgi:hypothetical protein
MPSFETLACAVGFALLGFFISLFQGLGWDMELLVIIGVPTSQTMAGTGNFSNGNSGSGQIRPENLAAG